MLFKYCLWQALKSLFLCEKVSYSNYCSVFNKWEDIFLQVQLEMRLVGGWCTTTLNNSWQSLSLSHSCRNVHLKTQDGSKGASCGCGASEHCRWLLPYLQYDAPLVHHCMAVARFQFCSTTECPCIRDWIPLPRQLISSNPNGWNIPSETHPRLCVPRTSSNHPTGQYWTANTLRHRLPDFL